ncbi:Tudor domain-containing protein [Aphelenchoides fujianensis]|nr:Tudor domain-containing protein [Aphelenchoides fujianensis]
MNGEAAVLDFYRMSTSEDTEKVQVTDDAAAAGKSEQWSQGQSCFAPYAEDGRWYPAIIVKIAGPKCHVVFTDYGDEEHEAQLEELLSESDVVNPAEEAGTADADTSMEFDKAYEPAASSSSADRIKRSPVKSARRGPVPPPAFCPPPPELFAKLTANGVDEKTSLTNMLMSWYMAGWHSGFHEGQKAARSAASAPNGLKRGRVGKK